MTKPPRLPNGSDADGSSPAAAAPTYSVGYCRPPKHTQFQPGQSGNRNGRRKRQRNVRTVVDEAVNEPIKIREGSRTRSVTKLDAMILSMMNAAVAGNAKSQANIIALVRSLGMTGEAPEASHAEPYTADDAALVAAFLSRHGVESAEPLASNETSENAEAKPASKETEA